MRLLRCVAVVLLGVGGVQVVGPASGSPNAAESHTKEKLFAVGVPCRPAGACFCRIIHVHCGSSNFRRDSSVGLKKLRVPCVAFLLEGAEASLPFGSRPNLKEVKSNVEPTSEQGYWE